MSGPKVDVANVIDGLFMQLADRHGVGNTSCFEPNEGIHFVVECNHRNFGYSKDGGNNKVEEWEGHAMAYVHVIVLASRTVFVATHDDFRLSTVPLREWKMTSNHFDCYRSDGFDPIRVIDYDLYKKAFSSMPEEHRPCYIMSSPYISMTPMVTKLMRFVRVKHTANPNQDSSYHRVIESITEFKMRLVKEETNES